jgi:ubiquitin C-terminal hydrolase
MVNTVLDMEEFCDDHTYGVKKYSLLAVVDYNGKHFTFAGKVIGEDGWYRFNDEKVAIVSDLSTLNNPNNHLLLYKQEPL